MWLTSVPRSPIGETAGDHTRDPLIRLLMQLLREDGWPLLHCILKQLANFVSLGQIERRLARIMGVGSGLGLRIRASLEQGAHRFGMTGLRGTVERRYAIVGASA